MGRRARRDAERDEIPEFTTVPSLADDQNELTAVESQDERRYRTAVALIALWKVNGMSQADAWRVLHPHDKRNKAATKMAASREIRWFQERYQVRFNELLDMSNLGRFRVVHELQALLQATMWCKFRNKEVPDWKAREAGLKHLLLVNGITQQGDFLKNLALTGKKKTEVEVGPPPESFQEWMEVARKVDEEARARYQNADLAEIES